ncbi:MAG: hypothetical protein JJE52_02900 [Acidimicrobiia bacterium]|nr:hypothetical protein [Acidimicrobiia bacterium]
MHKGHFAGCAIALLAALGFIAISGASSSSLVLLVAVLACPLAMVLAMKFLMGDAHSHRDSGHSDTEVLADTGRSL